eukprot:10926310-Ditylum_brightwellii.AAC.1
MDLIRAGILDIVWPGEVQHFINDGIFESVDDVDKVLNLAKHILPHICNPRCLARVGENMFHCRKLNNLLISKDNTKHTYKPLPNERNA